jgi:proteic killer suppression protein
VIGGFKHKGLEELFTSGKTRRINPAYIRKCVRVLQLMDVSVQPEDLNIAGYRFHGLEGMPKRWSVRISHNYRITFGWLGEAAIEVDFEDYH